MKKRPSFGLAASILWLAAGSGTAANTPRCPKMDQVEAKLKAGKVNLPEKPWAEPKTPVEKSFNENEYKWCSINVWNYLAHTGNGRGGAVNFNQLSAAEQLLRVKDFVARFEDLDKSVAAIEKKLGDAKSAIGKFDPAKPAGPKTRLETLPKLIEKEGADLQMEGKADSQPQPAVKGGTLFKELAGLFAKLAGLETVKSHAPGLPAQYPDGFTRAHMRMLWVSMKDGAPYVTDRGWPRKAPAQSAFSNLDWALGEKVWELYYDGRKELNRVNALVKEKNGSVASAQESLRGLVSLQEARGGAEKERGALAEQRSVLEKERQAAAAQEQARAQRRLAVEGLVRELQAGVNPYLAGPAALQRYFDGAKTRNEIPAGAKFEDWAKTDQAKAVSAEMAKGKEGVLGFYQDASGKHQVEFLKGRQIVRREVPEDVAQFKKDDFYASIGELLLEGKTFQAVAAAAKEATKEVVGDPKGAMKDMAMAGGLLGPAGMALDPNSPKEAASKMREGLSANAAERSKARTAGQSDYDQAKTGCRDTLRDEIKRIKPLLISEEDGPDGDDNGKGKRSLRTAAEVQYKQCLGQAQAAAQAVVDKVGAAAEEYQIAGAEKSQLDGNIRGIYVRHIKENVPTIRASYEGPAGAEARQAIHPGLLSVHVKQYFDARWDPAKEAEFMKSVEAFQKASQSRLLGELSLDDYVKRDFGVWTEDRKRRFAPGSGSMPKMDDAPDFKSMRRRPTGAP